MEVKHVVSVERLKQDNEKLVRALKFYADPQTYGISGGTIDRVLLDRGSRATNAIQSIA